MTRLALYVRAGGRCEFDGCNRYLLEHSLTGTVGNFAQMAHIVAFSAGGPRAAECSGTSPHDAANLMLLCSECHKLVDDAPVQYPAEALRTQKRVHEQRIFQLTDTHPDRHTVAFVLRARVGGRAVTVSLAEMQDEVAPSYLGSRDVVEVDLTQIPDDPSSDYWGVASQTVRAKARYLYEQAFDRGPARHVSVFALAPIPLLVLLGSCLSDKVPARFYQRHRDTESWKWKQAGPAVRYRTSTLRKRKASDGVALIISLSGSVPLDDLPLEVATTFNVYEISIDGIDPNPRFLDREGSLHAFRDEYLRTMRRLVQAHVGLEKVHLFPAVPAPVAVAVGRDLMPKRDPALLVYDYDKRAGGFISTVEVNS